MLHMRSALQSWHAKGMEANVRDHYQEVTTRILQQLELGVAPWIKPWSTTPGQNVPGNAVTGRNYSGVNVILLWLARDRGWPTPKFLTFKQAQELGGHVRKGEHGIPVYYVSSFVPKAERDSENPRRATMMKVYTVFNVAQCEGLPETLLTKFQPVARHTEERDATIDEFIAATGATVNEGGDSAYYNVGRDKVNLPAFEAFKSAAHYYGTAFHELIHWTGHKSRCDRDLRNRFGEKAYAAEELVAELGAAFLCAEFNIDGRLQHASYIANWIELLKNDSKAFFTAASKASKAVEFLRGVVTAEELSEAA